MILPFPCSLRSKVPGALPEQLAIRSTLVGLRLLDDHRLRDIGLRRSQIDLIAWRASPGESPTSRDRCGSTGYPGEEPRKARALAASGR